MLSIALTSMKQPYINALLNNLEQLSLLSSLLTVYCGLFYIADHNFREEYECKDINITERI